MLIGMAKPMPWLPLASAGDDGGVDADQVAVKIDHRAAGIAGIDRCVSLNEVFIVFDAQSAPPRGAHDAHGGGVAQTEGIADRKDYIANLQLRGIADGQRGQSRGVDLQHGDVRTRIGADKFGVEFSLVGELHFDVGRAVDHVIVGENRSVGCDDDAGAQALLAFLPRLLCRPNWLPWLPKNCWKNGSLKKGIAFCPSFTTFDV